MYYIPIRASPYLPKDPPKWCDINGHYKSRGMVNKNIKNNWEWKDSWKIEINNKTDKNGWQYASHFKQINWSSNDKLSNIVRRRKWFRTRFKTDNSHIKCMYF